MVLLTYCVFLSAIWWYAKAYILTYMDTVWFTTYAAVVSSTSKTVYVNKFWYWLTHRAQCNLTNSNKSTNFLYDFSWTCVVEMSKSELVTCVVIAPNVKKHALFSWNCQHLKFSIYPAFAWRSSILIRRSAFLSLHAQGI